MASMHSEMLDLIRSAHSGQTRNAGRIPYWYHCANVAQILKTAIGQAKELTDKGLLSDMTIAALGHDLLEDTKVTIEELRQKFDDNVTDMIDALTNYQGDADTSEYLQKIATATDEVKIIKYCDLIDNTLSVAYGLHDVGLEWTRSFYMPIALSTEATLARSEATIYPRTWEQLKTTHQVALELLELNLENLTILQK